MEPSGRGSVGFAERPYDGLGSELGDRSAYIASARETVYTVANSAMVEAYWNVGREIVEKQGRSGRAAYGDGLIDRIAAKLAAEFGPGYTRSNLRTMRQFYLMFPICHAVSGKLT